MSQPLFNFEHSRMSAIVIGAGINGLTCALRLLEDGWKVTVVAKSFSPNTTSDGAAGFWFPYFAEPLDKIVRWASTTLKKWQYMATHDSKATGCEFSEGYICTSYDVTMEMNRETMSGWAGGGAGDCSDS